MNQEDRSQLVMVLLVGGRLTPNFIGVLYYRPDTIECLVSEDERSKYDDVQKVLSPLPKVRLGAPHFVAAFDMQQNLEACRQIVQAYLGAKIVFNITCATKVMGIAAYEVAKESGHPAIYVDTTHGLFLNLTQPREEAIPIRICLQDYLSFYGRSLHKTFNFNLLSVSQDRAIAAAEYLAKAGVDASAVLAWLRQQNRGKGHRTIRGKCPQPMTMKEWKVLCELKRLGLLSRLEKHSETEVSYLIAKDEDWNFLDGTWLEIYVWDQAKKCKDSQGRPVFDECDFSFEIPDEQGARKEIDVGCMYKGQLILCSCKSGQNPFKTSYLDELRAVSSLLGGRFCSRLFITNARRPTEGDANWRDFNLFLQQAKYREIVVVTGEKLTKIGQTLQHEAEEPSYWRV